MRYTTLGVVAGWTFYEVDGTEFDQAEPLYAFTRTGATEYDRRGFPRFGELYPSPEHAMVAAVAEKYTGRRGAGGTAVDTAAGWFMRMIGADRPTMADLVQAADGERLGLAAQTVLEALDRAGLPVHRVELD